MTRPFCSCSKPVTRRSIALECMVCDVCHRRHDEAEGSKPFKEKYLADFLKIAEPEPDKSERFKGNFKKRFNKGK